MKRRVYCTEERCGRLFISQNFCVFSYDDDDFSLAQRKSLVVYALRHDRERDTHTHTQKSSLLLSIIQIETRATTPIPKAGLFLKSTHSFKEVRPVGADTVQLNRESTIIIVLVLYSQIFSLFFLCTP